MERQSITFIVILLWRTWASESLEKEETSQIQL